MKRIILLLTIMAACLQGHEQIMDKRTANWVFGFRAGLTWNTTRSMTCTGLAGTPDAVLNDLPTSFERPFNNYEGCFTMSDKNGKLLLYSDGSTLRDMNGNQYANGDYLGGNLTSSQSGIFIPYPGNSNKYIMVCVGSSTISPGALVYHEVDVSKKSITKKNQKFTGMQGIPSENVAAILQQNGVDYWIAIPGRSYTSGTPSYINT